MTLTVPCLFVLESLVADEMRRLNLKDVRVENAGGYRPAEYQPPLRRTGADGAWLLPCP